ncbi:MAG: HEPN domain-containing protein [Rhodospirillales bacterium]|nr:HEPN domain-containing protein [Rhodospirillales bacterium]
MTPATTLAFARAVESLAMARANLAANRPETTIHDAYYAMFRVARAFVAERAGARPKTHRGLGIAFGQLTRDLPAEERRIARRLGVALDRRVMADYDDVASFDLSHAAVALEEADAFVALCRRLMAA